MADVKPNVEYGKTRKIEVSDATLYLTVNILDGQITSVLIKYEKMGSPARGYLHVIGVLINELLDAGIEWNHIETRLKYHRFEPLNENTPSIIHKVVVSVTELLENG